ncbi:FXYD domain-containing ion transport regulator 5 isoform X2 [Halichoerus grypus]|uniref:FXYD domain-containing ion transport regulator 5 isoform X3 n=1 Tax=Halichoerus grypus TaxID=9711 RepID=UPI001659BD26|nr:FXYD domain-containing ion transport regulator 5 isoform X3 [Halichoerus grypus]
MSPSGRLCLLTIVGLILPTRGHILKEATSVSPADPARVNVHALTPAPDAVYPEPQPTAQTTLQTGGTTQEQEEEIQTPKMEETRSPQPTGMHVLLATDPKTVKSGPEGSSEENPFSYDEYTLRKRGLLVAAVLFITGIVILTSGKCRRLPQLCRNRNR